MVDQAQMDDLGLLAHKVLLDLKDCKDWMEDLV